MKVFWWQGGLHLEPESGEEAKALESIVTGLHVVDINQSVPSGPIEANLGDKNSVIRMHEFS